MCQFKCLGNLIKIVVIIRSLVLVYLSSTSTNSIQGIKTFSHYRVISREVKDTGHFW